MNHKNSHIIKLSFLTIIIFPLSELKAKTFSSKKVRFESTRSSSGAGFSITIFTADAKFFVIKSGLTPQLLTSLLFARPDKARIVLHPALYPVKISDFVSPIKKLLLTDFKVFPNDLTALFIEVISGFRHLQPASDLCVQ